MGLSKLSVCEFKETFHQGIRESTCEGVDLVLTRKDAFRGVRESRGLRQLDSRMNPFPVAPKSDVTIRASQPAAPKVFLSLQAGRGIAALMVVFYHCEGLFTLSKYWHRTHHYFYFGKSGVDFFFVLSGIVIFYAHRADIGRPERIADYAWKRFRRIYPIYWIVLLTAAPLYFAFPSLGDGTQRTPSVIFSSIVLLPFVRTETIVPVAWTLFHEIMFYLFFSLLLVRRRLGVAVLALWMSASAMALFLPNPSPSAPSAALYWVSPLHLLFGLGIWIAVIVRRRSFNGLWLAISGTAAFLACGFFEDVVRPRRRSFCRWSSGFLRRWPL